MRCECVSVAGAARQGRKPEPHETCGELAFRPQEPEGAPRVRQEAPDGPQEAQEGPHEAPGGPQEAPIRTCQVITHLVSIR